MRLTTIFLVFLIGGCNFLPRPDLQYLYSPVEKLLVAQKNPSLHDHQFVPPPVIIIHGIMGARLRDQQSSEEVWPGSLGTVLFSDYAHLALEIDPVTLDPKPSGFEVAGITDKVAGRNFYGHLIRTLERAGSYQRAKPGIEATGKKRRFYVFTYDWRQDNLKAVGKLAALIDQIRKDHNDPELKVDIVAHSMGGLITRYYLRYGTEDVLDDNEFPVNNDGAKRVRKVVLVGTPNFGSMETFRGFVEGVGVGLGTVQPEILATFPSIFQLFPHPIRTWLVTPEGKELIRDIFDINLWSRFGWSIFDPEVKQRIRRQFDDPQQAEAYWQLLRRYFYKHMERGRRFVWSLSVPNPDVKVRYIVFGGDCELTPARMVVENLGSDFFLRLTPDEIAEPLAGVDYQRLMLEPGDGSVTKPSLLARQVLDPAVKRHKWSFFPLDYPILFCENHASLTGNINFQNNLLNILLSGDER